MYKNWYVICVQEFGFTFQFTFHLTTDVGNLTDPTEVGTGKADEVIMYSKHEEAEKVICF